MEKVVPWKALIDLIEPHYPKTSKKGGRPPYPLATMLRIHLLQQWYSLSDPAMEEALIEVPTMRRFAGIELISDRIPDETTILTFRHLLEKHELGEQIFETVKAHLSARGMTMRQGTIVDATLIAAPSSTKNKEAKRDPEMHQTKKGNQWHHGMKAHIGSDADQGLVHSVATTAASNSFQVTATVTSACTVSGTTLNFGSAIDPLATATPLDANSTLSVTCTNTTPYTVALSAGLNAGGPGAAGEAPGAEGRTTAPSTDSRSRISPPVTGTASARRTITFCPIPRVRPVSDPIRVWLPSS